MTEHDHTKPSRLRLSISIPCFPTWSFMTSSACAIRIMQEQLASTTVWSLTVLGSVAMVCETLGAALNRHEL